MSDQGEFRWLSYAELAEARGIDRESAIRIARKHRWKKQPGNDGIIRVAVPGPFLESKRPLREEAPEEPREEFTRKISALETRAEMLTELVAHERGRAAAAETELKAVREQITDLRIGEAIARTQAQGAETEAERLRQAVDRLTAWPGAAAIERLREVWRSRRAQ